MSNTWDELRDLARKIEELVNSHKANSIVHREMGIFVEHIRLKARVHETNAKEIKTS